MKIAKHTWPWTRGQIISLAVLVAITLGLGVTGLLAQFAPEYVYSVSPIGLIVFAVISLALTIVYIVGNVRLKAKSTLFAEIPEEGFQTNVWMKKPDQYLYQQRLDKDRNKGDIRNFKSVKATIVGKNDVYQFTLKNDKNIWVPGRILAVKEVREFFQRAIDDKDGKIVTDNKETREALDNRLKGNKHSILKPVVKAVVKSAEDRDLEAAAERRKAAKTKQS